MSLSLTTAEKRSRTLPLCAKSTLLTPFSTAVPFWGQTTRNSSGLTPKRYESCSSKSVKVPRPRDFDCKWVFFVFCFLLIVQTKISSGARGTKLLDPFFRNSALYGNLNLSLIPPSVFFFFPPQRDCAAFKGLS